MQIEKQICANFLCEFSLEMPYLWNGQAKCTVQCLDMEGRGRDNELSGQCGRKASRAQLIFRDISSCHERKCPLSPTHHSPANFA